ncbi:MAG: ADP-ribosylation factor family protein [Candidatus Thorarchaeota archaeon]
MGISFLKKLFSFISPTKPPFKILILGLDRAGKTSFVNMLKLGDFTKPMQTMGINVETINKDGLNLNILDLGGQDTFRLALWPKFLEIGADAIFFVVDSTDKDRLVYNEVELAKLFDYAKSRFVPIVILANKQDLSGAVSPGEVALQMNLLDYTLSSSNNKPRSLQIFPTSMKTGEGVEQVIEYLKSIYNKKNN